ncbi:ATP-binding protein [Flavobacterium pedocola]
MRKLLTALFLIVFLLGCERKSRLDLSTSEKSAIDSLLERANNFQLSKEERIRSNEKAYLFLKKKKDSVSANYLFRVADRFYNAEEYDDFLKVSKDIYGLSVKRKDSLSIAKSLNYIADYYFYNLKNDSAYSYYTKVEQLYKRLGKEDIDPRIAFNKASILSYEKNFLQSEVEIIGVLKVANSQNDKRLVYDCYLALGKTSNGMDNYVTALEYYDKAYRQTEKLKEHPQYILLKAQPLNYKALVLQKQGRFSEALSNSEQALSLDDFKKKDPTLYCYFTSTYAYSKFKLGDNSCFAMFQDVLKKGDSLKSISIQLNSLLYLSEYHFSKNDAVKAKEYANRVLQLAHQNNVFEDELKALKLLTKIDPAGDSKYNKRYIALNDRLQSIERATRNKYARIEFETDEITQEKNVIQKEKERISSQRWFILGLSIFLIIALVLLYVVSVQRSRNKELEHMQKQQQANAEIFQLMLDQQQKIEEGKQIEKRRISKELHDGVMGKLTAIRLNLFVLNKRNDPETISRCIVHVNEIQNIEKEIRKISHDLNQNLFADTSDFTLMVENLVENIKEHSAINFKIITDEKIDWAMVGSIVKMQVYRILQESLQNIEKYAQARNVTISMIHKEQDLEVTVTDDGIGFNMKNTKNGIGHKNMRERAVEIGGSLEILSQKDEGTQIILKIPT